MARLATHRFIVGKSSFALLACASACGAGAADDVPGSSSSEATGEATGSVASRPGRTTEQEGGCDVVSAGSGWVNTFMPQSTGELSVELASYPATGATPPLIDTVVGLSNGPADSFQDLGPIVRFNDNGTIDARDGDFYVGGFPYRVGDGPFDFIMHVSIPTHRYSVWVRHRDSPFKPFELLGEDLAFRSEQSGVSRLDTIGRFTDSATGSLETCGFEYTAADECRTSSAGGWTSRDFPAQSDSIRVEFFATVESTAIDAVVGLSRDAPVRFADLAAIVRFRPDGTLDVRNGTAYGADNVVHYSPNIRYEFALDVNVPNGSYTASVRDTSIHDNPSIVLARDYAFRSEQASVASLAHLGQFVDGTPGSIAVCELVVAY